MHMADALLAPSVAGGMYALSAVASGYSIHGVRKINQPEKIPVMGVLGAFVFSAQMVNFSIPGTGASGHLCGGMLLGAVLGPQAGFLTMVSVLLIQCLLFADGGLLALGANVWNMAFYGCFLGGGLIWRAFAGRGLNKKKIVAASMVGCVVTMLLGAGSVVLETTASDVTELPFGAFLLFMLPIHLVIGLAEGAITAAALVFLYENRPGLLWGGPEEGIAANKMTLKGLLTVVAVAAVLLAGGISLAASSFPDGLEWSMERTMGGENLTAAGGIYDAAEALQSKTAVLPDYALEGGESATGRSFAGLLGGAVVVAVCVAVCRLLRLFHAGKVKKENE